MNEEIMVKFGGDLSGISQSIRGLKGMVADLKKEFSMGEVFGKLKEGLALFGVGFGAEKFLESGKAAMEMGEHIAVLSKELGVSTDFFQVWNLAAEQSGSTSQKATRGLQYLTEQIGKARDGAKDSIDLFEKHDVALDDINGTALTTQQVFEGVSKRILEVEDPATRAGLALQFFGKRGEELVETLENLKQVTDSTKSKIISETDIEMLEAANKKVTSLWQTIKNLSAKGWATAMTPFVEVDAMKAHLRKSSEVVPVTEENIEQTKDYVKALEEVRKARQNLTFAGANEEGKYLKALVEAGDLQREFNRLKDGTVEKLKAEKALLDAQVKVVESKKTLEEHAAKKKEEANRKEEASLKKQQDFQRDFEKMMADAVNDALKREHDRNSPYAPTLEDVSATGFWTGRGRRRHWQQSAGAMDANEIQRLTQDAINANAWGDNDRAQGDINRIEELKNHLSSLGIKTKEMLDEELVANTVKTNEHLEKILDNTSRTANSLEGD